MPAPSTQITTFPRDTRLPRSGRLLRAAGAALLLVLVLACAAWTTAARAAETGVALPGPQGVHYSDIHALGTHWVRMFAPWQDLEAGPGQFDEAWMNEYEKAFKALPAGSKVLLDVVDTPSWESGSSDIHMPPANPQDYAAMLHAVATRFGSRVSAYEIWNEEDEPRWWTGAPDPAAYASLLKAAYPAVKSANPEATVVMGGLTGNDYPFLEQLYAAGAKGSFDAVSVHTDTACDVLSPYDFLRGADNRMVPDSFLAYREVHGVMLANGDDKPIWMTELSWRTTSATCGEGAWAGQKPEGVTETAQASYLEQAYHCLAEDPYVQVALWFTLQDGGTVTSGLERADGSHKPSFQAMREEAHHGDQLKGSCGVFTGPRITIASPSNHIRYSGPLPIHVSARSTEGVFRIRLEVDGRLIRNYDGGSDPSILSGRLTWQGAKHISFGRHTLTFLAYDKEKNVSQRSITIVHTHPKPRKHRHRHH